MVAKVEKKNFILCVDDEKIILNSLKTQLKLLFQNEYEYEFAENGEEALEIIQDLVNEGRNVSIIISDYIMPGIKGDEFLAAAHKLVPYSTKILLSGQATLESVQTAINKANLYKYINKPWQHEELYSTIHSLTVEKSKQEVEKAVASSLLKSQFLANMSHEIRTPLNGVIGMLGLLSESGLNEEQKKYAEIASLSGESLLSLINDILDFSKIEAGKLELEKIPVSIRSIVEDTVEILSLSASEKKLSLYSFVEPNLPVVLGDPTRLRQILINFCNNALKFTSIGEIIIHVKSKKIENNKIEILFEVTDTGIGIPESKVDSLFSPFNQVDTSTTRKFGGTGLGLAISKQLTNMMQGEIGVRSVFGSGSTFWFTILAELANSIEKKANEFQNLSDSMNVFAFSKNQNKLNSLKSQCEELKLNIDSSLDLETIKTKLTQNQKANSVILIDENTELEGNALADFIKTSSSGNVWVVALINLQSKFENKDLFDASLVKPVRLANLKNLLLKKYNNADLKDSENSEDQKIKLREGFKILVAEDDKINQIVTSKILQKFGYSFEIAGDGQETLDLLKSSSFHLILMDCNMPVLDGWEATVSIRASQNKLINSIPIIALTADAMPEEIEKSFESGMNEVVTKPFNGKSLIEKIDKYLGIL